MLPRSTPFGNRCCDLSVGARGSFHGLNGKRGGRHHDVLQGVSTVGGAYKLTFHPLRNILTHCAGADVLSTELWMTPHLKNLIFGILIWYTRISFFFQILLVFPKYQKAADGCIPLTAPSHGWSVKLITYFHVMPSSGVCVGLFLCPYSSSWRGT
jgi:hypothetical protein